ncbi:GNAT family N-acetyltransferase [Legionella massiliensis]|nr:GNAT family N-acetyltransferase [Legionella massiliensis]
MTRSKTHFHPGKEDYVRDFVNIWGPRAYYVEDHILLKVLADELFIGVIGMRGPTLKRDFAELDLLFVDSHLIGKGYGRLLWNEVINIAKNQGWQIFRFISDSIPQIVGFYLHMGVKLIDEINLSSGAFPIMEFQVCPTSSS